MSALKYPHVVGASINWNEQFANSPEVTIKIASDFVAPTFRYEHLCTAEGKRSCFYAEDKDSGIVRFLAHDGSDKNCGGFGGAEYNLLMIDGSIRKIIGPWSSRAGAVNRLLTKIGRTDLGPSVDVTFAGTRGMGLGRVTLDMFRYAIRQFCPEVHIIRRLDDGNWAEPLWDVSVDPAQPVKPSGKSYASGQDAWVADE